MRPDLDPVVSVVIPIYNGGKYIASTLESILSQSYSPFEIIVIDDGSTDDGPGKVSEYVEKYPHQIRMLRHPDGGNHWITASRNLGIRNARGTHIAFVDSDDLWLPQKLECQMEMFSRYPDAGLVYARTSFIDGTGSVLPAEGKYTAAGKGTPGPPRYIFGELIKENFIPTLTAIVRKDCLERVGLFNVQSRYQFEDWIVFSKIAYFYKIGYVHEVVAGYRFHDGNYSAHISDTGRFFKADEHYTIVLFSDLAGEAGMSFAKLEGFIRRRIWYFFLRARSWGATTVELKEHGKRLLEAFPSVHRSIRAAMCASIVLPTRAGSMLRRIRRIIVKSYS
jgi:glycosyltransferase involved in cell wall biosynthesis